MGRKTSFLSAVVPVYNGEAFIVQTLKSLLHQTVKFDEIIVVDDGSTDRTVALVKRFKRVKLIQSPHVERIAVRNIGWKAAKGNIIAFIDSDLFLVKNWLKEILKGFDQGHVAAVDRRAVYQPKTYIAKMNDHFFDLRFTDNYRPFTAWVIRRDVLQSIGGLDECVIGFEDADLADRLYAAGYAIYFAKKAVAYHRGEPTSFLQEMRRHFWFGSHAWPYWKKTKQPYKLLRSLICIFLTFLLFLKPIVVLFAVGLGYFYVLFKDLRRGMHLTYLFIHPFIAVASEFAYAYGALYGLLFHPLTQVRKTAN